MKTQYKIDPKSGSEVVFKATDKTDPTIQIAIRKIDKKKCKNNEDLLNLQEEIHMLQNVEHPNIVKYHQAYESKDALYLCMELCRPNIIKNRMRDNKSISERKAAV